MSPRFQRRPDKRTGTGGRGRRFSGGADGPGEVDPRGSAPRFRPRRPGRDGVRSDWGDRPRSDWGDRSRAERPSFDQPRADRARPERRRAEVGSQPRGRQDRPRGDWGRPRGPERRGSGPRLVPSRPRSVQPLVVDAGHRDPGGEGPRDHAERHGADQPSELIWGRHAAAAALESGRPLHRIWCTSELRFRPPFLLALREAKASGVLVEEVTWARLGQITDGAVHQGIVLQPAAAETHDLESLIEACRHLDEPPLLMALDGITDPHNLGAIARSAEALGAHGLVLPQRRSAGLTGTVAKVAAGALEHLPVARVVNLNRALDALKQEGYRVVGLAAEGAVTLPHADLDGPLVIVTGSEGDGLSMLTRRHCDQLVSIPLRGVTPSLNASVATAMVLYEVARRGWMKDLRGGQPAPRLQRPQLSAAPIAATPDDRSDEPSMPLRGEPSDVGDDGAAGQFGPGEPQLMGGSPQFCGPAPDAAPDAGTMGPQQAPL